MNIIYARMEGYNWVSTPSDAVAREIEKLGHNITIIDSVKQRVPLKKYDFVWSPYESVTLLGDALSRKLNIPHFAHIEWIPPWRIFKDCDVVKYGFNKNDVELKDIGQTIPYYKNILGAYMDAEIRTISNISFLKYMSNFYGKEITAHERQPSIDIDSLDIAKTQYSPCKINNRVVSLSRLVQNKRYDILLDIMNKVEVPCEWVIIGQGPMKESIEQGLKNKQVKLIFTGALWGWARFYELMKASIFIGSWTGMPPLEAAYLNTYPIVVEPSLPKELGSNFLLHHFPAGVKIYKETDEVEVIAKHIDKLIKSKNNIDITNNITTLLKEGKLGIKTSEQNAKDIIKLYDQRK